MLRNWPFAVVLALFAAGAMVVPTMTQIATTDDWGYTRSVEILLDEGRLTVFPVVAATAVGQILWGALFGLVFGMSLGMMRVSTVVMVALGGIALYAILRQLGVTRSRSALGMALWLFNPLTYALAFSFMTDAHFASVMLISLAFYLRGLQPEREHLGFVLAASFFAGFAFLIRQQGALIPLAVAMWLFLSGRLWFRWRDIRRLLAVALLPLLMALAYYVWLRWFNDVPDVQEDFLQDIFDKGWEATWLLVRRIPLYVIFYA
ncbi:MAG: glycosyltransferase family 39 protein, partial [Chloroflexota bacterium]|nr:glycosyltransferase family 39 protein [Chloroflexota bacterium]